MSKAYYFHLLVFLAALCILYSCTSSHSHPFHPLSVPSQPQSSEAAFALPLQVNLLVLTKEPQSMPVAVKSALKSITSAWSWVIDLKLKSQSGVFSSLCCVNCEEKLDTLALYTDLPKVTATRQLDVIVVIAPPDCGVIPLSTVHYADYAEIPSVVISVLREYLGLLTSTEDVYVDGFTTAELCDVRPTDCMTPLAKHSTTAYINHQAALLNALIAHNHPLISAEDFARIEYVRASLDSPSDSLPELQAVAQVLTDLVGSPGLAAEEYFQLDFKIGVYAPLFFPPLFPVIGGLYWRFLEKRRLKVKTD
jgi:hypothetical protein